MSKKKLEAHKDYDGPRTPIRLRSLCGWCMPDSDEHEKCKREVAWYENLWICGCPCADEHWNTVAKVETNDNNDQAERAAGEDCSESSSSSDEAGS